MTGDAEVRNLFSGSTAASPASGPQVTRASKTTTKRKSTPGLPTITGPGPQQGTARLRLSSISLIDLAHMFSTKAAPYDKLNPSGSVAGTVNLAWTGSIGDASADLALDVTPPTHPSRQE